MPDYTLNNTIANKIDNPFATGNSIYLGTVTMSFKDVNNQPKTVSLISDGTFDNKLVIPAGVFARIGDIPVDLVDAGGVTIKKVINITGYTSGSQSNSACGDPCGNGSSTHNSTSSVVKETIKNVENLKNTVENITKTNHDLQQKLDTKICTFEDTFSNTVTKANLEIDKRFLTFDNDIEYIKTIKDELPKYREIKDDIEEYKRLRTTVEMSNEQKFEDVKKDIASYKDSVLQLKSLVNNAELGSKQLEIYNQTIEKLRQDITCNENSNQELYANVLTEFSKTSLGIAKFQNQVATNTKTSEDFKTFKKTYDEKQIKDQIYKTTLEQTLDNLDYSKDIQELQESVQKSETCCEQGKAEMKLLKERICALEGQVKELNKFKTNFTSMLDNLKQAGFDNLSSTELTQHVTQIKAGH